MPKLWIKFEHLHHHIWTHPNKPPRTARWSNHHPPNVNWRFSRRFSKRLKHCSNAWKQIRYADIFCKHPSWHLTERCDNVQQIKWYLNLQVEFTRGTNDEETDKSELYFKSKTYTLLSKENLTDHDVNESFQNQFASFDEYIARDSGWTLSQVIRMKVHTAQYRPIGGSN